MASTNNNNNNNRAWGNQRHNQNQNQNQSQHQQQQPNIQPQQPPIPASNPSINLSSLGSLGSTSNQASTFLNSRFQHAQTMNGVELFKVQPNQNANKPNQQASAGGPWGKKNQNSFLNDLFRAVEKSKTTGLTSK